MMFRALFLSLCVALLLPCLSQAQVERSALNNIGKRKWTGALKRLQKALQKDSLQAGATYMMAVYYFEPANPDFSIDSADCYANLAFERFVLSSEKEQERLQRLSIDSTRLSQMRDQIDSAAFERAKSINTEQSYTYFLTRFLAEQYRPLATELRYEAAYVDALKENTYQAFQQYLSRYPESTRKSEAKAKYELLLFETLTRDRKLRSYEQFVSRYPDAVYRPVAEREILERSTADGSIASYQTFLNSYPKSQWSSWARGILFHLYPDVESASRDHLLMDNDSLHEVLLLNRELLFPFLSDGKYGFMNGDGRRVIDPVSNHLDDTYLCGGLFEDVVALGNQLMARNGKVIFEGDVSELEEIGAGYLIVTTANSCRQLVHKSGRIYEGGCLEDAQIISDRFVAIKSDDGWSLLTLTLRSLPLGQWEEITSIKSTVALKRKGQWYLAGPDELAASLDVSPMLFSLVVDEFKSMGDYLWIRKGLTTGLMDDHRKILVNLGEQDIRPAFYGAAVKTEVGVKMYSSYSGLSDSFSKVIESSPYVAVQKNGAWYLFSPQTGRPSGISYDSIFFIGAFAMGKSNDSLDVYYKEKVITSAQATEVGFIPGRDSLSFVWFEAAEGKERKKVVYNPEGKKLFAVAADKISYVDGGMFVIQRNEKKGLLTSDGTTLLACDYDAIGDRKSNWIPLLKSMRFGLYDVTSGKEIKCTYDKNIIPFNQNLVVAFKNGHYGFVTNASKDHSKFEYDEIVQWTDTLAWVKQNFRWALVNVYEKSPVLEGVRDFRYVKNSAQEKIVIFRQENAYGVLSNRKGVVVQPTFSDIVNIGTSQEPVYFAEKHVEEASLYVVVYYNGEGTLIHRQAFDEAEYDRIYCSDN